jgi:hypothetical protein
VEARKRWFIVVCVTGAIVDVLAAIQMLVPRLFAATSGLDSFHPGSDYRYAMGMGASLMLGWTALLIWAALKPVERRQVLLMTACPVILGMVMNEIRAVHDSFLTATAAAPIWLGQAILVLLCLYSYMSVVRSEQAPAARPG